MIQLFNTAVLGFDVAIRGMRNPMNSWDKSDSGFRPVVEPPCNDTAIRFVIGKNDLDLMKRLVKSGTDHSKFMRMINVTMDVIAPLYWWKEFDTYKVGTVRNSCSTMHKITAKEFTRNDFSCEHLPKGSDAYSDTWNFALSKDMIKINKDDPLYLSGCDVLDIIIIGLNHFRQMYLETKDKKYWYEIIQLLPSSYNQGATIQLNYAVLRNIYHSRKCHKLDEWRGFCEWIKRLPYSELITMEG